MPKRPIEPGRRYRELRRGPSGRHAGAEWIVENLDADELGVMHARLVSAADRGVKTLSVRALADPSRFEEEEEEV
jgi:hypothetical protein